MKPLVAVLIPNWNGREDLLECLGSLAALDYPKDRLEIIVCDNASADGSMDAIRVRFEEMKPQGWHRLQLVALPENRGIAAAYNAALERADPQCFAVLRTEGDVRYAPDLLSTLVDSMVAAPDIGVVGCRVLSYADPTRVWYGACFMNWWIGRMQLEFPSEPLVCNDVAGCCMLIRTKAVRRLPIFFRADRFLADERDLCFRLRDVGYGTLYQPKAVTRHKGARSTSKMSAFTVYHSTRDSLLFINHFNRFPQKLSCLAVQGLWALRLVPRRDWPRLIGIRDAALTIATGRLVDSGRRFV